MPLVVVGSAKGSPGATTLSVALAQFWSGPATVVECDLAGGDVAARFALAATPNLAGLAARVGEGSRDPWSGARQRLAGDAGAVVGGVGEWELSAGLDWGALGEHLAGVGELVLADVGRLGAGPLEVLGPLAQAIVLVAHNELSALSHVRGIAGWVAKVVPETPLGLVLVGEGPWADQEVSTTVGIQVLGRVDWVQVLAAPPKRSRVPDLRPLERSGRRIVAALGELMSTRSSAGVSTVAPSWAGPEAPVLEGPGEVGDVDEPVTRSRAPRVVYGPGARTQNGSGRVQRHAEQVATDGAQDEEGSTRSEELDGEDDTSFEALGDSVAEPEAGSPIRRPATPTRRPGRPGDPGLRTGLRQQAAPADQTEEWNELDDAMESTPEVPEEPAESEEPVVHSAFPSLRRPGRSGRSGRPGGPGLQSQVRAR